VACVCVLCARIGRGARNNTSPCIGRGRAEFMLKRGVSMRIGIK